MTGRAVVERAPGRAREELAIAALALLLAAAAGSALIVATGESPIRVWSALIGRTLGHPYGIAQVLFKATPLVFTGLAVAVALRVGLFNIGVEGQMVAGLLACGVTGAALPDATPAAIALPSCLLAAAAAGGALGAATGALRAYRGAHEVIVSIMLNAIVIGIALWLGDVALFVGETTRTADVVAGARLPDLGVRGSPLSAAWPIAIAVAAAMAWLFARTRIGAAWRTVGAAPGAARAAGISVERAIVAAMATSGALAGLAAAHFVLGYKHAFEDGLGRNVGFLGIAVALVGRGHPGGVVAGALLLGLLSYGGLVVADLVPKELFDVLQGVIVLSVAAAAPLARRALRGAAR
jgi:general nucleoside transport system permease protein